MEILLQIIIVSLKFIVPILMLHIPFGGVWGNYLLDIVDGDILMGLGLSEYSYQTIDKVADLVSYMFMLILGLRWRIRKIVTVLFAYRLIGQLLFFATRDELVFFYFQNFLEPLLLIYTLLILIFKSEEKGYAFYKKHIVVMWGMILVYKIWNEWYLHFANIDLSLLLFGVNGGK